MLVSSRGLKNTGSLGAKCSLVDGMLRIAFDIDDFARLRIRAADQAATHRAVAADGRALPGALHLVDLFHFFGIGVERPQVDPEG